MTNASHLKLVPNLTEPAPTAPIPLAPALPPTTNPTAAPAAKPKPIVIALAVPGTDLKRDVVVPSLKGTERQRSWAIDTHMRPRLLRRMCALIATHAPEVRAALFEEIVLIAKHRADARTWIDRRDYTDVAALDWLVKETGTTTNQTHDYRREDMTITRVLKGATWPYEIRYVYGRFERRMPGEQWPAVEYRYRAVLYVTEHFSDPTGRWSRRRGDTIRISDAAHPTREAAMAEAARYRPALRSQEVLRIERQDPRDPALKWELTDGTVTPALDAPTAEELARLAEQVARQATRIDKIMADPETKTVVKFVRMSQRAGRPGSTFEEIFTAHPKLGYGERELQLGLVYDCVEAKLLDQISVGGLRHLVLAAGVRK